MAVKTADPTFGPIQRQMNKIMDQMQKGFFNFCPSETWTPSVNLYEVEFGYLVCVDMAGVVKDEIDVQVSEHRLTLRGTRAVPIKPPAEAVEGESAWGDASGKGRAADERKGQPAESNPRYRVHLMEIDHGPFCREVELPEDVSEDRINATYRNGLLWIELPKK